MVQVLQLCLLACIYYISMFVQDPNQSSWRFILLLSEFMSWDIYQFKECTSTALIRASESQPHKHAKCKAYRASCRNVDLAHIVSGTNCYQIRRCLIKCGNINFVSDTNCYYNQLGIFSDIASIVYILLDYQYYGAWICSSRC